MRIVTIGLASALVVLSIIIYQVKYETRSLETRVELLQRVIAVERDVIAILRAEWSHLNRPVRLERLAREHLNLRPVKARQISDAE